MSSATSDDTKIWSSNGYRQRNFMTKRTSLKALLGHALLGAIFANAAYASLSTLSDQTASDFMSLPLTTMETATPMVMMVMSRDEQLFKKAYSDYTDLDGDGLLDTTYINDFVYTGYFDSNLCYTYIGDNDGYRASSTANNHQCTGNNWSGNFLNWLTMSRLDVLRFVLYGGYRSQDTGSKTVLERAHIPNDVHAWAKVYSGPDTNLYTPYSGTVSFCNASFGSSGLPKLRKATGNWSEWASTAITQCAWRTGNQPSASADTNWFDVPSQSAHGGAEFTVRVDVCRSASGALQESFCREYSAGNKPAGLLQQYGENGSLRFGLMTGSFSRPRSGGVLRRNIGQLAGNGSNPAVCVAGDEIKLSDGTFCNQSDGTEGIINTINRLKIDTGQWNNSPPWSDCSSWGIHNRVGGQGRLNNPGTGNSLHTCSAWGNPLTEIFAEALRYLTGEANPTANFTAGNDLSGLPSATWRDPYGNTPSGIPRNPYCANCSILVLSTGLNSFDSDEIPAVAALAQNAVTSTQAVGEMSGIHGNDYYVGRIVNNISDLAVGAQVNTHEDMCEARTVVNLANVRGICPDIPTQEGSYLMAGLAYQAWTQDVRPDLNKPADFRNRIQTYAVALAENLPKFEIPVGNGQITLSPLCQANSAGNAAISAAGWRSCYLANVTVGPKSSRVGRQYIYGRDLEDDGSAGSFTLVWEDSQWGNDFDNDVVTMVTYCVGSACELRTQAGTRRGYNGGGLDDSGNFNGYDICWRSDSPVCRDNTGTPTIGNDEVLVRIEHLSAFAGNGMLSGYAITGTDELDGIKRLIRRPGGNIDGQNQNGSILTGFENPRNNWDRPNVSRYRLASGNLAAQQLENPLFYAAKYGGFDYSPGDSVLNPALNQNSWDRINNEDGTLGSDGLPDNFFPVRNPAQLKERLAAVFNSVLERAASGTAAAVVANAREGEGAAYQALFEPLRSDADGREVQWIGNLHALFIDEEGFLREDFAGNASLGDYSSHPAVEIFFDEAERTTRFRRYFGRPGEVTPSLHPLSDLRPIWSASDQLSRITNTTEHRSYNARADMGRHILTWVDENQNGRVDAGEVVPFVASTFTATQTYGILNVGSTDDATRLVNWVRGQDQNGFRSRELRVPLPGGESALRTMRLSDIVHSTPTVVAAPAEAFDLLYNDEGYGEFRERYRNRRNVVYVGSNGGMLHAFNAGFYDAETDSFSLQGSRSEVPHPLGGEIWSFVPYELLPHLPWLVSEDYAHVPYVDGKARVFDARIFDSSDVHPNGWGTVLVVGLRFGGGEITLPASSNAAAFNGFSENGDITTRPSYIVLDVTDPEREPTLLASISHPDMNFTMGLPAVVTAGNPGVAAGSASGDNWYLVFGNGPESINATLPNAQSGSFFVYDLNSLSFVPGWTPRVLNDAPNSFVGDPVVVDWDLNFKADAIYFGSIGGSASAPNGKLFKIDLGDDVGRNPADWTDPIVLVDPQRPIISTPAVTFDESGNRWVFAGTGRFFSEADKLSEAPQTLFGVIDSPAQETPLDPVNRYNALINTTDARIATSGFVEGVGAGDITNESELMTAALDAGGWRLNLPLFGAAERSLSPMSLFGDILFASVFTPSTNLCGDEGNSRLFGLYYKTGAARSDIPAFGTDEWIVDGGTLDEARSVIDIGPGLAASPSLHLGTARDSRGLTIFTQTSTGAIERREASVTEGARSGEVDWRERY
jgi:type IV pilus assembly protein PilY1